MTIGSSSCPLCRRDGLAAAFTYDAPPPGETPFELPRGQPYAREYRCCGTCGHYLAFMGIDLDATLYSGAYVDATYRTAEGLEAAFERIMSLPPHASDNAGRVERINTWWRTRDRAPSTVLDVGSGLGVFAARMKLMGWRCTNVDPDPRAADFARARIGIEAVCAEFMQLEPFGPFGLVTLNKVLEHVRDPVGMLSRAVRFVAPDGALYVEVPDGEAAANDVARFNREEFFIEHLHVFSMTSLSMLADRAGLDIVLAERIREPSGKYTLFAFLIGAPPG